MLPIYRVIAYVRVSTPGQLEGTGLDHQAKWIKDYCNAQGYKIARWFREARSGVGADSIAKRPELQKAVSLAKKNRWPILVVAVDRVGRDEASVKELMADPDLTIIPVNFGEHASESVLEAHRKAAARKSRLVSESTKAALKRRKADGVLLGNRTNLPEASRMGAAANRNKAHVKAEEIAGILADVDPDRRKSKREIAEILNQRGCLTDRGLSWDEHNIRRTLVRADKINGPRVPEELTEASTDEFYKGDPLYGRFA